MGIRDLYPFTNIYHKKFHSVIIVEIIEKIIAKNGK
jgi:hypothetical protein